MGVHYSALRQRLFEVGEMDLAVATATQRNQVRRRVVAAVFPFNDVMNDERCGRAAMLAFVVVSLKDQIAQRIPRSIKAAVVRARLVRWCRGAGADPAAVFSLPLHAPPCVERLSTGRAFKCDSTRVVVARKRHGRQDCSFGQARSAERIRGVVQFDTVGKCSGDS